MSAPEPAIRFGAAFMPERVIFAIFEGKETVLFEMTPGQASRLGHRLLAAAEDAAAEPLDLADIIAALNQG